MHRFFATTLGQILAIIVCSSVITFLLSLVVIRVHYPSEPPPRPPWPWPVAYRVEGLVKSLQSVPGNERAAVVAGIQWPGMSISLTKNADRGKTQTLDTRDLEAVLKSELHQPDVTVRQRDSGDSATPIQVLVGFGEQTLEVRTSRIGAEPHRLTAPFIGALLFLCVAVAAMSAWAVWRVGPLKRLSARADAFGRNVSLSLVEEEGPLEIRRAARAFNLMQERVTRSIQDRTRALAAISHDLRTPLTRMRLQLETGQTDSIREKLLRDVGLMQSMITSALVFLSGSREEEEKEWFDLGVLLSTLCDEYEEAGAAVSYQGPEQIRFFCRPNAISRALTNLIENGIHFGKKVVITASVDSKTIVINVADDGPGIPVDQVKNVVEPFVRLDPARSNRPGSVGLGLSIVKEIVEAHDGTLELLARKPTGLIAKVILPA